jgi:hypothetical protein
MPGEIFNQLQLREIFHLEFLRWFTRRVAPEKYALKGGSNLRFFFGSVRYSEDMDIDIRGVKVGFLKEEVMGILKAPAFKRGLIPFGIEDIVPPDITKAKQTETTQRFKVHLISVAGEDLFTKIEFSRRGFKGEAQAEQVSEEVMRRYKVPPLLVAHYDAASAMEQKIGALTSRAVPQARDIFDLYILSAQFGVSVAKGKMLKKALQNIYEISFEQFRDTVLDYLIPEDRVAYDSAAAWDEIRLKVTEFLERLK